MHRLTATLLFCAAAGVRAVFAADAANEIKGFAPVTVSAANYRESSREEILRSVDQEKAAVNPEAPQLKPLKNPQRYVFMRGEVFESDLTYEQVTALLQTALAKKGYLNAADAQGRIYDPEGVALVLRVNYGTRLWRLPTVRSSGLAWEDGMIAKPRGMGLHLLGGDSAWDERAGGNDDVFTAMAANDTARSGGFSSGSSRSTGASAPVGAADAASPGSGSSAMPGDAEFGSTRDFHLIVVDAFDYRELKKKGRDAKRMWSTFISAPKQGKQKFSEIAAALARNAAPYFGETSKGLQVYSDTRAEVKIGEIIEVKDDAARK